MRERERERSTNACCIKSTPFTHLEVFLLASPVEAVLVLSVETVLVLYVFDQLKNM